MGGDVLRARDLLASWRTRHAGQPLPIALHLIEALATRAAAHDGQARAVLDARLAALLDAPAARPARAGRGKRTAKTAEVAPRSALAGLLQRLAEHGPGKAAPVAATALPKAFPELPALDEFRRTWAKVRTDSQLRQSLVASSEDAGPLNSAVLVNRAIHLMRDAAPGYLQHFVAYVDALSWMEQLQGAGILASRDTGQATPTRKPARRTPRKR